MEGRFGPVKQMEVETSHAALCIIRNENAFLVAEIKDPQSGPFSIVRPAAVLKKASVQSKLSAANCKKNWALP